MPNIELNVDSLKKFTSFFKKKEKYSVGIDIGSSNIKIVELENNEGKLVLRNYVIVDVDKELVLGERNNLVVKEASLVIRKALEEAGIKTKKVNSAVPSFASLITTLEIPRMNKNEIENVVNVEAPKYIPAPMAEVIFGWQIISGTPLDEDMKGQRKKEQQNNQQNPEDQQKGTNNEANPIEEKIRILLVAVMKDVSKKFEDVIRKTGLDVGYLEVDAFSLKRSLIGNDLGNYIILDVGQKITNVILVSKGNLVISRNIDIAGNKFTEVISKGLGIGHEKAVQLKMKHGLEIDQKFGVKLLDPVLRILANEIKKEVDIFNKNYPNEKMDGVILSGGTSRLKGLNGFIQAETGIKTFFGNPWAKLEYPEKLKEVLYGYGPAFAVAIGLAMLSFEEE